MCHKCDYISVRAKPHLVLVPGVVELTLIGFVWTIVVVHKIRQVVLVFSEHMMSIHKLCTQSIDVPPRIPGLY